MSAVVVAGVRLFGRIGRRAILRGVRRARSPAGARCHRDCSAWLPGPNCRCLASRLARRSDHPAALRSAAARLRLARCRLALRLEQSWRRVVELRERVDWPLVWHVNRWDVGQRPVDLIGGGSAGDADCAAGHCEEKCTSKRCSGRRTPNKTTRRAAFRFHRAWMAAGEGADDACQQSLSTGSEGRRRRSRGL